jgi:hypothetical protein
MSGFCMCACEKTALPDMDNNRMLQIGFQGDHPQKVVNLQRAQ